ncbi:hypothetical protein DSM104299_04446 [Baekduia alba]|uniref:hypothetical protein n=1 Tax=Baekduia alba TaxID=2997333 RepID=UPI0023424CD3|nr:hypothetical protein [Baekduia alba]WCB95697.1 hypothetical protein DSM104299_04446 [Baekduia alba]
MPRARVVSISVLRWRARAPRVALITCCSILSLAGLRATLAKDAAAPTKATSSASSDDSLDGFAEAFARAFVAPATADPADRDRAMKAYGLPETASAADASSAGIRVRWSTAVASQPRAGGGRMVTVLLDDGRRSWYLAVPVGVDRAGRRFVPSAPSLVGPPAVRASTVVPAELEVDDAQLREVAARVIRHYLAGDRVDLAADLARGAAVTLPPTRTRLVGVEATTWAARPTRVAVAITAAGPGGVRLSLRYELRVVHVGGRWLVRGIQVNPLS